MLQASCDRYLVQVREEERYAHAKYPLGMRDPSQDTHAQDNIQRLKEKSALDGHARSPAAVGSQSVGTLA
jgi:hypothetical protein